MDDLISRQAAIDAVVSLCDDCDSGYCGSCRVNYPGEKDAIKVIRDLPPAEPERLTDEDFETIRIHLNAYKEQLCNQHRWEEAEEYQRIIDRFMAFASAQPERKNGKWIYNSPVTMKCNQCGLVIKDWDWHRFKYCPNCEADMRGEQE